MDRLNRGCRASSKDASGSSHTSCYAFLRGWVWWPLDNDWDRTARWALPGVAVAIAVAQPAINFREQDKSGSVEIHEFLKAILDSTPPRTLLLETGDYTFHGLRYMQTVEQYRTDVHVLDQMVLG